MLRRVLLAATCLVVLVLLGMYGSTVYFLHKAFTRRVQACKTVPEDLGLKAETIDLTSSDGIPLKGWWVPAEQLRGSVIVLHGMDGLDASCLLPHARFLHDAGWSAFLLDMRAHGRSGGQRIGLSIEEPRDVSAALDWLEAQPSVKGSPIVLLGLSMGGAVAIRTAASRPDVDGVISVSGFASLDEMMGHGLQLWLGRLAILTLYHAWTPLASAVHDIPRIRPRPVLLMHGTADHQVPVEQAYQLKSAAGPTAELWIAPGADHLIFTEDGIGKGQADSDYRKHILEFLGKVRHQSAR
jgi:fermentation-respiration switch protein FrsA (DUF1100 family)